MKITLLTVMLVFLMAKDSQQTEQIYQLDMMEHSVDDMYDGCELDMEKLENKYLKCELEKHTSFKQGWDGAESCENEKYNTRENKELTKNQIRALCVYTDKNLNIYGPFNAAVREGRTKYTTKAFEFYALHYLLTSALKIIKAEQKECHITYRRNPHSFNGKEGDLIRFGQFASTSKSSTKIEYGKETCFQIETCYGVFIQDYSVAPDEEEVLIPPYEVFEIEIKETGSTTSVDGLKDCTTIFKLKSKTKDSKLNCQAPDRIALSKVEGNKIAAFFMSLCCGCVTNNAS